MSCSAQLAGSKHFLAGVGADGHRAGAWLCAQSCYSLLFSYLIHIGAQLRQLPQNTAVAVNERN
jgi:hypothetical protein